MKIQTTIDPIYRYPGAHAFQFEDGTWGVKLGRFPESRAIPFYFKSQEAAEKYAAKYREVKW